MRENPNLHKILFSQRGGKVSKQTWYGQFYKLFPASAFGVTLILKSNTAAGAPAITLMF